MSSVGSYSPGPEVADPAAQPPVAEVVIHDHRRVDVEALAEPLEGHQVLVLDGGEVAGLQARDAGRQVHVEAEPDVGPAGEAQAVVARDGGVREPRHARVRGRIEVVLAGSDAAARRRGPSSACRRRCRGARGARSPLPWPDEPFADHASRWTPLVRVHWSAAAGAASEARRAAEQERARQAAGAGRRARDSVGGLDAHFTITSTSLRALPAFGASGLAGGRCRADRPTSVPVIISAMCFPTSTPDATLSRLFGSRNAPSTASPFGARSFRFSLSGMTWHEELLHVRVPVPPAQDEPGDGGIGAPGLDHARERVDALVGEGEVRLPDGGDGGRRLHREASHAGAHLGDDLAGDPRARLAAGQIEARRGRLVGGVDVQLVDLEVGQLADPHEAAVSQHHLGGAALARADAVALGEPRALLERLGGRLALGDHLHRGPREDDLGGARGLGAPSRRPEEPAPRTAALPARDGQRGPTS